MMKAEAVTNMNIVQENLDHEEKVNHDQKEEMTWNVEDQKEQEKKIRSAKDPGTDDPKADQYSSDTYCHFFFICFIDVHNVKCGSIKSKHHHI